MQARDGLRRIIVCEEAWDLLSNPQLVDSLQTRQRSAGHWGCATWLIVHGVADMTQVFTAGSGLRGKVEQLMNLMETKIIYRQGGENIPLLNRLIPDLPGPRLWHLAYRTRASTHDTAHRRPHVGGRVRHVEPAKSVVRQALPGKNNREGGMVWPDIGMMARMTVRN